MRHRRPLIGISSDWQEDCQYGASFLRVRPEYADAVRDSGGVPVILPLMTDEDVIRVLIDNLDGILLSGGGDIDPARYNAARSDLTRHVVSQRDGFEHLLITLAVAEGIPMLAICRGHQMLNVSLGGTLHQDITLETHSPVVHNLSPASGGFDTLAHEVNIAENSQLAMAMGGSWMNLQVNSLHHQGIRDLATPLRVSARAQDGLIEGVEHPDHPFLIGVQWHPESLYQRHDAMHNLFMSFIQASAHRR